MNKNIAGIFAFLLLAGCLAETGDGPTNILPLNSPVDSSKGIRHQEKGNIIGRYNRRTPRRPGEWRELNKEQTNPLERLRRGG